MPEIGEVARVVHYIRKHLLHRTITTCTGYPDDIVYGKVGTSAEAFQHALTGRRVTGADQQGKYFYMTFDQPPHAVMHLGMTGWMKFDVEETGYYKQAKEKESGEREEWPPKYMKFLLRCEKEGEQEAVEAALVDARRLARIRLVDCPADDIRNHSPLKENGPDPVRDKDVVTVEWLQALLARKRVPVKALLLDQANLSGIGNWVADEILYQSRIHPEQYSNTFSASQIAALHRGIMDVCTLAVETRADSRQFPETWLMKYRWDKGKKEGNVLPGGERIVHLKVGGRTSAIVPSVQRKTGAVAGDVGEGEEKVGRGRKRKVKDEVKEDDGEEEEEERPKAKKGRAGKVKEEEELPGRSRRKAQGPNGVKKEEEEVEKQTNGGAEADEAEEEDVKSAPKKSTKTKNTEPKKKKKATEKPAVPGERRSTRTKPK